MRLLYASHAERDPSKGSAWADLALLETLRRRGHEVEEVWNFGSPRRIRHDNLHILLEAPGRCVRAVLPRADRRPFDVVLVNQPLGWIAGRRMKRRWPSTLYVARSHGWEPRVHEELSAAAAEEEESRGPIRRAASTLLRPLLHAQNTRVVQIADGVVVCSTDDRAWLTHRDGLPESRVLAMPPGIAAELLTSPAPEFDPLRLRRLLYVGQFAPFKAPEVAAAAMARVLAAVPESTATWVCGRAHHPRVEALFPGSVRGRLTLRSWMPRGELARVYDEAGIYFFPSYFEGFAQTFLEAMARGVIVLASRIDGMREAIRDGENGFLFEPSSERAMADCALSLIAEPERAEAVGLAARKTAEGYTWEAAAEKFEQFVSELRALGPR